jgi:hypothetical protein
MLEYVNRYPGGRYPCFLHHFEVFHGPVEQQCPGERTARSDITKGLALLGEFQLRRYPWGFVPCVLLSAARQGLSQVGTAWYYGVDVLCGRACLILDME